MTRSADGPFNGWSVIEADDADAARQILEDQPFIGRGGQLQVSEPWGSRRRTEDPSSTVTDPTADPMPIRGDQNPFVYQTSPQQYSDEPSASPQITWAMPAESTAIPK